MNEEYLFVYGTLRQSLPCSMYGLIEEGTVFAGLGWVAGYLYDIGGYPGMVQGRARRPRVRGEVYGLRDPRATLAVVDDYEQCSPRSPTPHEYRRKRLAVTLDNGGKVRAWCYVYIRPTRGLRLIRGGDYVAYVRHREKGRLRHM